MSTSRVHTRIQSGWVAGWRLRDLHRASALWSAPTASAVEGSYDTKGSCALKFQWLGPLAAGPSPKARPTEAFSFSKMTASHNLFSMINQARGGLPGEKGRRVLIKLACFGSHSDSSPVSVLTESPLQFSEQPSFISKGGGPFLLNLPSKTNKQKLQPTLIIAVYAFCLFSSRGR